METSSNDYLKSCKLIEAYVSFFEKLSYSSVNCDQNLDKLVSLKKKLYLNVESKRKIEEILGDTFRNELPQMVISSQKLPSNTPLYDVSPQLLPTNFVSQSSLESQNKDFMSFNISTANKEIVPLNISINPIPDNSQDTNQAGTPSWCTLDNTEQLLNRVKPSLHFDGNRISTLINSFAVARAFNQPHESIVHALCASFFERHILYKFHQLRSSLSLYLASKLGRDNDIETLAEYLDGQFASMIKNQAHGPQSEKELITKYYEALVSNSNLYNSCILTLRKVICKILDRIKSDSASRKMSFQWMNEIENVDKEFYGELASVFGCNLNFFVLSSIKFNEFSFKPADNASFALGDIIKSINNDTNILIDKSLNWTYLLYPSKVLSNSLLNTHNTLKKGKQRSFSPNIYRENRAKEEEVYPAAMNLEIFNKKSSKLLHESDRGDFTLSYKLAGRTKIGPEGNIPTLNLNFSRKHSEESENKILHSKDLEKKPDLLSLYDAIKTEPSLPLKPRDPDATHNLIQKHTEHIIPKHNDFKYIPHGASLADRIMEEINQKVKAEKEKEKEKSLSPGLNASPIKDQYVDNNSVISHSRNKSDVEESFRDRNKSSDINYYPSGNFNILPISLDKHFTNLTNNLGVSPGLPEKQMTLPSHLKAKVQNCNKIIDQNNAEFNKFISYYLGEDFKVIKDTMKVQYSLMLSPYDSMLQHTSKKESQMQKISATMQMDSKA